MRIATLLLLGVFAAPAGERPVTVAVRPAFAFAPGSFLVRTTVTPHEDNRTLTVAIESSTYRQTTTVPLEGEDAPRARVVTFIDLPVGEYVIEARVARNDGTVERDARDVVVYAESPSPAASR